MTKKLSALLKEEGDAVEAAERSGTMIRSDVKITRGHDRARTLQIRLNDDELAELSALAEARGLPVSTVARQLLLQSLTPADGVQGAMDRLEHDLAALRRQVLAPN